MNQNLQTMAELFTSNAQSIRKDFFWQNTLVKRLAALLYAAEDKVVDTSEIRKCHELIKQNTGLFSMFRGNLVICLAAMLSLSPDSERQFSNTLTIYDMLKKQGFRASDYLAVGAYQIAARAKETDYLHIAEQSKKFYDGMKSRHWFLTGQDDYIFSAMLGLSGIDATYGVERIEELYQRLKPEFFSGNAVQSLAQIMVLCENENINAVERVLELRNAFRQHGIRLDREYTLSSLGVLALLPAELSDIVNDVSGMYDYLRMQRGFGIWSVTKQELLLFSSALVSFSYTGDRKNSVLANLSTHIASIIIAQQTAIAVAAASSAASSSSN